MVCIATLLISLTAGMFLLAKTKKDNLGAFYNIISWFIIALSLGCLLCCGIRTVMHGGCREGMRMEKEIIINGEGFHHGMGRHHGMMRGGNCCERNEECCDKMMDCCKMNKGCAEGEAMECSKGKSHTGDCCEEKKEMKFVKDSVVIKK